MKAHLERGHCNLDAPKHDQGEQEEQHGQCCHDICYDCPDFAVTSGGISCCASRQLCCEILQAETQKECNRHVDIAGHKIVADK